MISNLLLLEISLGISPIHIHPKVVPEEQTTVPAYRDEDFHCMMCTLDPEDSMLLRKDIWLWWAAGETLRRDDGLHFSGLHAHTYT